MEKKIDTIPEQEQGYLIIPDIVVLDSQTVQFASSSPSVVKVDQDGYFFARDTGYAIVSAQSDDFLLRKIVHVRANCNRFSVLADSVCHGDIITIKSPVDDYIWFFGSVLQDSVSVPRSVSTSLFPAGHVTVYAKRELNSCADPRMPVSFYIKPRPDIQLPEFNYFCSGDLLPSDDELTVFKDSAGLFPLSEPGLVPALQPGKHQVYLAKEGECLSEPLSYELVIRNCSPDNFTVSGSLSGSGLPATVYLFDEQFVAHDSVITYNGEFMLFVPHSGSFTYWANGSRNSFYYGGSGDARDAYFVEVSQSMYGFDIVSGFEANSINTIDFYGFTLPFVATKSPIQISDLTGKTRYYGSIGICPNEVLSVPYILSYFNGENYVSTLITR